MLVIRVIVRHWYTKYEVRKPSRSEDMVHLTVSALIGLDL